MLKMKKKQNQSNQYKKFLESHKSLAGLTDWKIILVCKKEREDIEGNLANTCVDEMEKEVTITLYKNFYDKCVKQRYNILMHELIHGRIAVYMLETETFRKRHEEILVNDLTRGFERINYGIKQTR